jgi:hypothetical protein
MATFVVIVTSRVYFKNLITAQILLSSLKIFALNVNKNKEGERKEDFTSFIYDYYKVAASSSYWIT